MTVSISPPETSSKNSWSLTGPGVLATWRSVDFLSDPDGSFLYFIPLVGSLLSQALKLHMVPISDLQKFPEIFFGHFSQFAGCGQHVYLLHFQLNATQSWVYDPITTRRSFIQSARLVILKDVFYKFLWWKCTEIPSCFILWQGFIFDFWMYSFKGIILTAAEHSAFSCVNESFINIKGSREPQQDTFLTLTLISSPEFHQYLSLKSSRSQGQSFSILVP